MAEQNTEKKEWTVNDYSIQKVIGEGSYGRALLATDKQDGQLIVVKEISFANLTEQERNDARKETMILSLLKHPNIIGYKGSFLDKNIFHIIMDYADGGDLSEQIENATTNFDEDKILNWFVQICLAIKYIHDRKILHRDLKTQNIFLMRNGTVKLGDFGIAKVLDHTTSFAKTSIGTPYYLSPEICLGRRYNTKSDIWSLGCILYEMCTLKHPFDSNSINGLIMKITKAKQAPIPKQYSAKLHALVDTLLAKQPSKRPTVNQILSIDFIQAKIGNLLSSTLRKIEFSHTVFHGVKGGITPEIESGEDQPKEQKSQPKTAAKKPVSRLPTKKPPTASKGTRSQANPSLSPTSSSGSKNSPSTSNIKSSSKVPVKHSSASSSGNISSSPRSTTSSTSRNMNISGGMKISKETAAAAAAEREAQKERREQEQAAKKQREELEEKKRQEAQKKRKESGNAQKNKLEQLRKEEAERQKKYKNLEAPFKKVRQNMDSGSSPATTNTQPALTKKEKELTKRPGTGGKNREKEISSLHEIIRQKKAEAAKMKKKGSDTIQIGTMTFDINGEPINENKETEAEAEAETVEEDKKPPMRVEDLVLDMPCDDDDDDDLLSLAVIAQNMQDHPPSDDEGDDEGNDEEEDDITAAARKYTYKGKPVEISKSDGSITASVRKFIVKGIGQEKLDKVYHLVKDQSEQLNEDQVDAELKKILKTDDEMEYYPLIQQLVVDENPPTE